MNRTVWYLWPIQILRDLLEAIARLTSRLVAAILGLAIMLIGFVLRLTILAAPVGIPMVVFGFLLMVRGIF